jgi:hypothetical protein
VGLGLDVFRSALSRDGGRPFRNPPDASRPAAPILMYVMGHFPGNTARSWTRQLWGDIAHGVKMARLLCYALLCFAMLCYAVARLCPGPAPRAPASI